MSLFKPFARREGLPPGPQFGFCYAVDVRKEAPDDCAWCKERNVVRHDRHTCARRDEPYVVLDRNRTGIESNCHMCRVMLGHDECAECWALIEDHYTKAFGPLLHREHTCEWRGMASYRCFPYWAVMCCHICQVLCKLDDCGECRKDPRVVEALKPWGIQPPPAVVN